MLTGRRLTLTDRARVVQRGAGASWWGIVQWGNAFPNATLHPHPHHVVQCTLSSVEKNRLTYALMALLLY